jgi:hypothetical protein
MTRKHYVALAAALAATMPDIAEFTTTSAVGNNTFVNSAAHDHAYAQWCRTVRAISDVLAADNPNFDRTRFQHAATDPKGRAS